MNTKTSSTPDLPAWPNTERRVVKGALWVTALAVLAIFAPGLLGIEGMHGGFAISFVSFFIAICGIVVALMFRGRAAEVDRLLAGFDLLAHWQYPADLWRQYVAQETVDRHSNNRGIVVIVAAWAIPIGLLFWLFDHEGGLVVLAVMLALVALMVVVGWALPVIWRARRRAHPAQTWISDKAAFFDGVLFRWTGTGNRLEQVSLVAGEEGGLSLLCLDLRALTRTGWQPYALRIPVPDGQMAKAKELVEILSAHIS